MLSVMPFGDYGDVDEHERPIHLSEAVRCFAKALGISKVSLQRMIDEVLNITHNYLDRVFMIAELPELNKEQLRKVVASVRSGLSKV